MPVSCAGVVVNPGDLIRGDENGVVVVPKEIAEEIIAEGEKVHARETRILELLQAGVPLSEAWRRASEG